MTATHLFLGLLLAQLVLSSNTTGGIVTLTDGVSRILPMYGGTGQAHFDVGNVVYVKGHFNAGDHVIYQQYRIVTVDGQGRVLCQRGQEQDVVVCPCAKFHALAAPDSEQVFDLATFPKQTFSYTPWNWWQTPAWVFLINLIAEDQIPLPDQMIVFGGELGVSFIWNQTVFVAFYDTLDGGVMKSCGPYKGKPSTVQSFVYFRDMAVACYPLLAGREINSVWKDASFSVV